MQPLIKLLRSVVHLSFLCALLLTAHSYAMIRGELTSYTKVSPGEKLQLKIPLENESEEDLLVRFKVVDYLFNAKGETFYEAAENHPRSNASWIELQTTSMVIPPKTDTYFFYTVQVPQEVPSEGSYWSLILIEPSLPLTPPDQKSDNEVSLTATIRYGYQVVTNVGQGKALLKVLDTKKMNDDEKRILAIDIGNPGEIMLKPKLTLDLYDEKGYFVRRFENPPQRVFPSTSIRFQVDLDDIKKDKYVAFALFDCGEEGLFGHRFTLDETRSSSE